MNPTIHTLYFSPTGTTEKIVARIAQRLARNRDGSQTIHSIDCTLPEARKKPISFDRQDLVVTGVPVYAGRVPNVLLKFLHTISGNGATAVAVVLYGNRHYDDALIEFTDILTSTGFHVVAGGAFVGEHSFSTTLGKNRPDDPDIAVALHFADSIHEKLQAPEEPPSVVVNGNRPYRDYYRIKGPDGTVVSILKVTPRTSDDCIDCKRCAEVCPMGSIDSDDVSRITGICIKCCACVKKCPVGAKYFDDKHYLRHKEELEAAFTRIRREPECFL